MSDLQRANLLEKQYFSFFPEFVEVQINDSMKMFSWKEVALTYYEN